jgi:hypothetical protein
MKNPRIIACLLVSVAWFTTPRVLAQDSDNEVLAGHSYHGEAFNEGPRQAAYIMSGLPEIDFPVTTSSELAQKFFTQGVGQLHGFWYYEAERSFRQAAVEDPDCAMAYWGMAMANTGNRGRAQGFMKEAVAREADVSPREQLYIQAYAQYCQDEDDEGEKIEKKERAQKYTRDLETIVEEYPDDIEAKAFLALQLWQNRSSDLPIVSYVAVNSLLQEVFDANPMHPAHHYRIHLWDGHKPKYALESAALCGQSSPAIAHMWHMPGHIYDKLHRYHDAAWQQEASARVDHAHMMRDRVMPDQIHNFAHNNEWLIRSYLKIGRVKDALDLAKNMTELPRHPKYNVLEKRGSTRYGRERLWLTLSTYRLWPELIELSQTSYLEPTTSEEFQIDWWRQVGLAYALNQQADQAKEHLDELKDRLTRVQSRLDELQAAEEQEEAAETDSVADEKSAADRKKAAANRKRRQQERKQQIKDSKERQEQLEKACRTLEIALAAAAGDWKTALGDWDSSDLSDKLLKAEWLVADEQLDEALKLLDKQIEEQPGQLLPLAVKAFVQYQTQDAAAAVDTFEKARELATQADLDTPLLARLTPLAVELGIGEAWLTKYVQPDDVGQRPGLDSLGPFRWHPYLAPDFVVRNKDDHQVSLKEFRGKPTLVIFYLGFGCLHCVEQLHEFSPRAQDFRDSGIEIIGVSTENILVFCHS